MGRRREKINWPKMIWDGEMPFQILDGDENMSVADAKRRQEELFKLGKMTDCLCCSRAVKPYPRKIHRTMVIALMCMAEKGGATAKDIQRATETTGGGDHSFLPAWGLAVKVDGGDHDEDRWFATRKGLEFLAGKIMVEERIVFFRDQPWGRSREQVTVRDAYGEDFDYVDLMDERYFR